MREIRHYFLLAIFIFLGHQGFSQTQPPTSGGVYQISTYNHLLWIQNNSASWSASMVLTQDIDMSAIRNVDDSDAGTNDGWIPLGNTSTQFTGSFDGRGYTITGLYIDRVTIRDLGFFGQIGNATIKNITFEDATVRYSGSDYNASIGGVIGEIDLGSTVLNINYTGDVYSSEGETGGLIGETQALNQVISYSTFSGTVSHTNTDNVGGIIGEIRSASTIEYCTVLSGSIEGQGIVGGIVGKVTSMRSPETIRYNSLYADVESTGDDVGGIIGEMLENGAYVNYNVIHSDITGDQYVGGMVGNGATWNTSPNRSGWNIFSGTVYGDSDFDGVMGDSMDPCATGIGKSNVYDKINNTSYCGEGLDSTASPNEFTDKDNYTNYEGWSNTQSDLFGFSANVKGGLPFVPNSRYLLEDDEAYLELIQSPNDEATIYGTSSTVTFVLSFTNTVTVDSSGGVPYFDLDSGGSARATYKSGSGTKQLTFTYDVNYGDASSDLDITSSAIQLNGGTIKDTDSDTAIVTFPLAATGRHFSSMYNIQVDSGTPTVTLSSSDSDDIINLTQTVSITATFNKNMQSTPTITIPGVGTYNMALTTASTTWHYDWDTTGVSTGTYAISVNGTATNGESYTGTDTLSLDVQKRIYLDTNGVTIKCPTANVSETAIIGGKEYIVVDETALRTRENNGDDMTCVYFKGVQHE